MKRKILFASSLAMTILIAGAFTSCKDDDNDDPTSRTITIENVTTTKAFVQSGTFGGTTGTSRAIAPGASSTQIKFHAGKGQYLNFVMMYGNSKDLFFAPVNPGIRLFDDNGQPILTNLAAQVKLWDNGTIQNTDPALTAANQPTVAENFNVTEITGIDRQGFSYPAVSDMLDMQMTYNATTSEFTLTIRNTSNNTTVSTPFSEGVWAVSNILGGELLNSAPFYTAGERTSTELTQIATQGDNVPFKNMVEGETGIVTGLSPMLVVVYTGDVNPLFTVGQKDPGLGLKELAQSGNVSVLRQALERERAVRSVFVVGSSTLAPGQSASSTYQANGNEKIALATMFGYSNDWFYSNNSNIGALSTGDKTAQVSLYDNGTAVSQYPGAGNAQAGFNNTPITEDVVIKMIDAQTSGFTALPAVSDIIKVTIN